jgi:5'-3' exonuclease
MGVRKLNKFLTNRGIIKTYQNIQEFISNVHIKNNTHNSKIINSKIIVAIDFWLYVHKFLHSNKMNDPSFSVVHSFMNQIIKLLSNGIIPLYVMDGSIPVEKYEIIRERIIKRNHIRNQINNISKKINKNNHNHNHSHNNNHHNNYYDIYGISKSCDNCDNCDNYDKYDDHDNYDSSNLNDKFDRENSHKKTNAFRSFGELGLLEDLRNHKRKLQRQTKRISASELHNIYELFNVFRIPFIKAEFEADAMCAKLYKENIISACMSDDMDMLALGCGSTIKFDNGKIIEFDMDHVKKTLGLSHEQFVDMCILFGCDYLRHSIRLDCDDVYDMIKKHGSLLDALSSNENNVFNMNNNNVKVIGENYYHVQNIYLNSCERENIPKKYYDIKIKSINVNNVFLFLNKMLWFKINKSNVRKITDAIRNINVKMQT